MSTTAIESKDMEIKPDGMLWIKYTNETAYCYTRQGLLEIFEETRTLRDKVREMDYLANRAMPSRFLPKLLAELEHRAASVGTPRDEAYAMAALLIRKSIGEEKA